MVGSPSTSTTTSGGGGKSNCDSNGFGKNNSLRVYQVTYNIKTYEVQVQAYSTCGFISAKMITPTQQSILRLSLDPPYLDDRIVVYFGFLDESEEKFNISIQNKKQSFDETFYIHDKSIIKKYIGETGYTSEQEGTALPTIISSQTTVSSEKIVSQIIEELVLEQNQKQIVADKVVVNEPQLIGYTSEPTLEKTIELTCGIGTKLVNGICKIIMPDESKFCFLFWHW